MRSAPRTLLIGALVGSILMYALAAQGKAAPRRFETWRAIADDLDDGAADSVIDATASLLAAEPARLELADLYGAAMARRCREGSAIVFAEPAQSFAHGAELRFADRYAAAAAAYRAAADLVTDDAWSRAVALLNAVECLTLTDERVLAHALLDTIGAIAGVADVPRRIEARALVLRAKLKMMEAEPDAGSLFERTLALADSLGARALKCDCWAGIGTPETNALALREAERLGDPDRMFRLLVNLAFGSGDWSRGGPSDRYLDRADSVLAVCPQPYLAGYVDAGRGHIHGSLSERDAAVASLRSASEKHLAAGNHRGELTARQWLAYQLQMSGRYREAVEELEICLAILDEHDSRFIRNWIKLGLGNVQRILGDPDAAVAHYETAADLFGAVGRYDMKVQCLTEMGSCFAMQGDYRAALRLYGRSATLDRERNRGGKAAYILNFEGDCHFQLGNYNEALDRYEQAVAIAEARGSRSLLYAPLGGVAAVHAVAGRPEDAVAAYRRALEVATRHRDREYEVRARIGIAEQDLALGRRIEAEAVLAEAATLLSTDGQYGFRSRILMLQARYADDPRTALRLLDRARASAVEGGLPEHEWNSLSALGLIHLAQGDTTAAAVCQERAIRVVESLRRRVGMDDLQRNLMTEAIAPYERLAHLLCDSDPAAALAVVERSRARILAERLERSLAEAGSDHECAPTPEQRELRAALTYAMAKLQDQQIGAEQRAVLRREIEELESRAVLLCKDDGDPDVAAEAGAPVAALLPGECALYYFLGEEHSALFVVAGEVVRAHVLPPRDLILKKVRLFLALRDQIGRGLPREAYRRSRDEMRRMLIEPAVASIATSERLVIVPDGVLARLPFALLDDVEVGLLAERDVMYVPSLKVLAQLRRRHGRKQEHDGDVLAIGCLNAVSADGEVRMHPFAAVPMPELPGAAAEAAQVGAVHPGAVVRVGDDATESALAGENWSRFALVHVAAHGYADDRHPERSFIVLNAERDGEDGLLQRHEIAALDLSASLVVLSSCRSASGPLSVGEGVTGLAQAFLDAGARCVLATLDDVPDDYAVDFMLSVHERLAHGASAAEALRVTGHAARIRDAGGLREFLWADFVLIGDASSPVLEPARDGIQGRPISVVLLVLLGVFLLAVVIRKRRT